MALKPDRIETQTDISFFMNTTGERGGVVSVNYNTAEGSSGSGVSMDDGNAVVAYAAAASGALPIGVLLNDVVNYDLTRQHINWHKDEVQVDSKVAVLRVGQVTTNVVVTGTVNTTRAGAHAYLANNGNISADQCAGCPKVGQFLSGLDADGYAKVSINIT
jgi:hypothetical protein